MKTKTSFRVLSLVLLLTILLGLLPNNIVLADDRISVDNAYIEVTAPTDGTSFGINTLEGNPSKKYDNNKPLLYDGDDKFATSYTTVRIVKNPGTAAEETADYVYGSSKGTLVQAPYEYNNGENSGIITVWSIDGVEITQTLAVTGNTSGSTGGYVGISYSYKNTTPYNVGVGVRILLDTKIGSNDGGQFYKNGGTTPITKEVEFAGDNVPEWYSIADSITYSTTNAYGLLRSSAMKRTPDKVQMAHWFNLANTLWDYTVNGSLNFDDYYNEYSCPDSAISIMFNPELIASGASSSVDTLYGIGDFSTAEDIADGCVITVTQKEALKPNSTNTGYENDGEITLYVTIDNSDKDSEQIVDGKLRLVFEDKVVDEVTLEMTQEPAVWVSTESEEDEVISVGNINRGSIKRNIPVTLKARPVYENDDNPDDICYEPKSGYSLRRSIDTRKITLQLTGDTNPIPSVATKYVTLPSLGEEVDIGFTGIDPKTIYYQGYSFFSVQGVGKNFEVLKNKANWTAYLKNIVTGDIINIDSLNCSVDASNKQLGLTVDMGGILGEYELTIKFQNELAPLGERVFSDSDDHIKTSDDEKYKNRGYSVAVIARTSDSDDYEMTLFSSGGSNPSAEEQFTAYRDEVEENDGEILIEARGVFKVLYKEGANLESDNIRVSTNPDRTNKDIIGFETIPGSDNIKLNRILYYNSMTPLSFKADFDGNGMPREMRVDGDGDLSIINASTIWKHGFKISIVTGGEIYTYDTEGGLGNSTAPKLQLLGGGWLLQNMGGFIFTLNYGELGCQDGRYTINFSGSLSFPLGFKIGDGDDNNASQNAANGGTASGTAAQSTTTKAATSTSSQQKNSNQSTAQSAVAQSNRGNASTTGSGSKTSNNLLRTGNESGDKVKDTLGAFNGGFSISVDSILFGEHEDRDDENNIKTGFVGVAAEVSLELPDWVFPASGKQTNDPNVSKGAAAANPTTQKTVPASNPKASTAQGQNQNASSAQEKKKAKMSAFSIGAHVNSYDFEAGADVGVKIGDISVAARLGLAEMPNGKIMLDTIYLEVKGFTIPIVPGILNLSGLGGGISDIAASIGYEGDGQPPITVSALGVIDIVTAIVLQADLEVSGNGLAVSVTGAPKGFDKIKFVAKAEVDWTSGVTMTLSGTADLFSGVVLGNVSLGFTTSPKFFFMGKIVGTLNIPGLGSLAGVTLAITNEYIAGGARVLIFSGGFVYYYDSDKFRLLQGSEVDELESIDLETTEMPGQKQSKTQSFLEVHELRTEDGDVQYMGIGAGAQVVQSTIDSRLRSGYSLQAAALSEQSITPEVTEAMMKGNDVVLRLYYEGDTAPTYTVKKPDGSDYPVVLYDTSKTQEQNNDAGANMLLSEKTDSETGKTSKYAYITLDNDKLAKGNWTVTSTNGVNISDYTVLTIPTVNPRLSITSAALNNETQELTVSYEANEDAKITVALVPCNDDGSVVTEAVDGQTIEHPGYIIADGKAAASGGTITGTANIPSGKYVVRVDSILNDSVYTYKYTTEPINYVNPKTLAVPQNVTAYAGGDGRLDVTADLPENATGIWIDVYKCNSDGSEEKLTAMGGYAGDFDNDGKIKTHFKGENTLLDDTGTPRSGSKIEPGATYRIEAYAMNANEGGGYFKSPAVKSGKVTIPTPKPPQVDINVVSYNAQNKTDDKGRAYLQTSNPNIVIEYNITDSTEPNDEVTVSFDIDDTQFGSTVTNNAENGYKGYAAFSLTDGEHLVNIIFKNKNGDVTEITKRFSVDTIPADIKVEYPQNGSYFDPAVGIPLKLTTDDDVTIDIYLDEAKVVSGDYVTYTKSQTKSGSYTYSTVYEKTISVPSPKYSHELKVVATDRNGNSTTHTATVVNKTAAQIGGIKIKGAKTSDAVTELTAVGLDSSGNELSVAISQSKLKWTMLSDPSFASLVTNDGNSGAVVLQNAEQPFTVQAQWDIGNEQYLTDIYDSGIVGTQNQETVTTGTTSSGGGGGGGAQQPKLPEEIEALIKQVKAAMSSSAEVEAYKQYAGVDSVSKQDGNAVFAAGKDIAKEGYIVIGTDKNTAAYTDGLPEGAALRSDILQLASLTELDKTLLDFEVTGSGDNSVLGVYKYAESIGKWIYIGGVYDEERGMMSADAIGTGRYAVIENPRMSEIQFADTDTSWAELYIRSLAYGGLIDGSFEDGVRYYRPTDEITRGEFVKLLASAGNADLSDSDVSMFADADEIPEWARPYAAAAYKAGWLKGVETERGLEAKLSDRITRQDAMVLVYRVFFGGKAASGALAFADSSKVAEYAAEAVSYLTENGIVSGYDDGTLGPLNCLQRDQIAKILWISILK